MATRRARKVGIGPEVIQDLALWIFGGGIVGARVCFILLHDAPKPGFNFQGWSAFWESFLPTLGDFFVKFPRIWDGGIIFYGAVIGATLSYFVGYAVSLRHKPNVTTLRLADIVAPTVAVGLLLGRVGCFLNGCCYGQVACASCPAVSFPMSAPARFDLTAEGLQTAAGFLVESERARVTDPPPRARVTAVEPGSAAEAAGLKVGDLIVAVNGKSRPKDREEVAELPSTEALSSMLVNRWPRGATELQLNVERDGEVVKLPAFQPRTLGLQPTQVYESISMFLVLLLLLAFDAVKRREGQGMALLMICYGLHRYFNEMLRIDTRPVGFESSVSVLLVVGGIVMMIWLALRPAATPAPAPTPTPEPAPKPQPA
jgi:prolipoprotein diacylglyceryltransferase